MFDTLLFLCLCDRLWRLWNQQTPAFNAYNVYEEPRSASVSDVPRGEFKDKSIALDDFETEEIRRLKEEFGTFYDKKYLHKVPSLTDVSRGSPPRDDEEVPIYDILDRTMAELSGDDEDWYFPDRVDKPDRETSSTDCKEKGEQGKAATEKGKKEGKETQATNQSRTATEDKYRYDDVNEVKDLKKESRKTKSDSKRSASTSSQHGRSITDSAKAKESLNQSVLKSLPDQGTNPAGPKSPQSRQSPDTGSIELAPPSAPSVDTSARSKEKRSKSKKKKRSKKKARKPPKDVYK